MRYLIVVVTVSSALLNQAGIAGAAPAAPQVQSGPTASPAVSATDRLWYVQREPVPFAGDLYYPAGASQFFNGNSMVRSGTYDGVPLYVDATLEPYSIVYVPIGGGLMQPYERPRRGDVAGTTGSRSPSFPVGSTPGAPFSVVPPPRLSASQRTGAVIPVAEPVAIGSAGRLDASVAVGPTGTAALPPQSATVFTILRPQTNDGLWVQFAGQKWIHDGGGVRLTEHDFIRVGDYAGFAVFAKASLDEDVIYLPTRAGIVAPYRLRE